MSYVISLTLAQPSFITTLFVVWKLYKLVHFWDPLHNNYETSALPFIDSSNLLTVCLNPNSAQISGPSLNRPKSRPV